MRGGRSGLESSEGVNGLTALVAGRDKDDSVLTWSAHTDMIA